MIRLERPAGFFKCAAQASGALVAWAALATLSSGNPAGQGGMMYLEADGTAAPAAINLRWNPGEVIRNLRIRKRLPGAAWQILTSPKATDCHYTDFNVVPGTVYEYSVEAIGEDLPVDGTFVWSGIDVPATHHRGSSLLVVEKGIAEALSREIEDYMKDLAGDGWSVARIEVESDMPIGEIKASIRNHFAPTASRPGAVVLIGRVPVPYSGTYAPDGHWDHHGAWPADAWYGDLGDAERWTDTLADTTGAATPANWNVPGDGKFDQITLPNSISLQVGRIDLSRMAMASSKSEVQRIKRYLDKNHQYRFRQGPYAEVARRGLIDDNIGVLNGEQFAASAARNFAALFGSQNVAEDDWFTRLGVESYLWAMGNGSGSFTSCSGVGTTADFSERHSLAVFTMFGGSYFGDWNTPNNFLRAPLAGERSLGLVSLWTGRPNGLIHPMALGATIGHAVQLTHNNSGLEMHYPDGSSHHRAVHIGLMGDPTLRLHYPEPPSNVVAGVDAGGHSAAIKWDPPGSWAPVGYYVYRRAADREEPFRLLSSKAVTATSFIDRSLDTGSSYAYLIRALVRETSGSGSYWNLSQGALADSVVPEPSFDGPEISVTYGGESLVSGGALTLQDGDTAEFTVTNSGSTSLFFLTTPTVILESGESFKALNAVSRPLATGEAHTFSIVYSPSGSGAESVMLSIASNDADEPIFHQELKGSGKVPARSYAQWLMQFPELADATAEPSADPDLDGLDNYLEYAYGGIPTVPDSAAIAPAIEMIDRTPGAGAGFRIRYRQVRDFTGVEAVGTMGADYQLRDVRYLLEVSADGEHWAPDPTLSVQVERMVDVSAATVEAVIVVQTSDPIISVENIRFRAEQPPAPRSYAAWAEQFGDERVSEPDGDPDEDGMNNLLEYAFGGHPLRRGTSSIVMPDLRLTTHEGDGSEIIEIASRQLAPVSGSSAIGVPGVDYRLGDLRYRVEISTDMVTWLSGALTLRTLRPVVTNDDGTVTSFVSPWVPASFFNRGLFVRMTVSLDDDSSIPSEL